MDPITLTIISYAVPSIIAVIGGWFGVKKNKEVKELAQVMKECPTPDQDLRKIAIEAGLEIAAKVIRKHLKV